ncbi:5' nucleotidase, NT5C type [Effusibacillus dendaii]|uniref:5'(3')-deoxyribonucleotidase n=1 Tax=Effusibacillus dendaii TaxID=2743772 RepID=A0A7I8DEU9_9BACL|nr:5'(3')-deoxyribonucleotidase [Effusibacillus dendaii]BCJ86431.1 5'(3')-deoxyribonucleotidase [Effusibacillus dendaii]
MKKKILCIDMDSVLVDLMSEWHGRYNRDYQDDLTPERVLSWDAKSYVKPECGEKIYEYLKEPGLFSCLQPLPHAVEVMERLTQRFDVVIVTAPPSPIAYQEKEAWVAEHLPFLGRHNLIFAHRKDLISGDLLFDDAPPNLNAFMAAGRIAVAMDYPYNRNVNCPRVSGWLEFEQKVDQFLSG